MAKARDDFSPRLINNLKNRSAYICSNPDCKALTIAPSIEDENDSTYIGVASHITAAAEGGPRYDVTLSPEKRSSIENAIFLCSSCSVMIDKNDGIDFSIEVLKKWKDDHEKWVRKNLNKKINDSGLNLDFNNLIGGDGFGYIALRHSDDNDIFTLSFVRENSKYSLFNVNIHMVDLTTHSDSKSLYKTEDFSINEMLPSTLKELGKTINLRGKIEQKYNIFYTARNGRFEQLLRLYKIKGNWCIMTKVTGVNGEIVHEDCNSEIPPNLISW